MTSLWRQSRLTYYDLGPNISTQGVEVLPGEVWQVSKRNSQYFRSYLRKTTRGALCPPPSGARVIGVEANEDYPIQSRIELLLLSWLNLFLTVFTCIRVWGEYQTDILLTYQRKFCTVLRVEVMRHVKARKASICCKLTILPTLPGIRNISTNVLKNVLKCIKKHT